MLTCWLIVARESSLVFVANYGLCGDRKRGKPKWKIDSIIVILGTGCKFEWFTQMEVLIISNTNVQLNNCCLFIYCWTLVIWKLLWRSKVLKNGKLKLFFTSIFKFQTTDKKCATGVPLEFFSSYQVERFLFISFFSVVVHVISKM